MQDQIQQCIQQEMVQYFDKLERDQIKFNSYLI